MLERDRLVKFGGSSGGGGDDFDIEHDPARNRKKIAVIATIVVVSVIVITAISMAIYYRSVDKEYDISKSLNVQNIMGHLTQLNNIANTEGGGSRSIVDAYNASANYVISALQKADFCDIQTQAFKVPVYVQLAAPTLVQTYPNPVSYVVNRDFSGTRYGGNGTFNFEAHVVVANNYGCSLTDFPENTNGNITVVFDGNCTQYQKALNAEQVGAKAILIVNAKGSALANWRVRSVTWNETDPLVQIPVFGITYSLGLTFQVQQDTTLNLTALTQVTIENTFNVLCLTRGGTSDSIIVMGAHLDSVPEGPGINDNGSGSASVLEVALEAASKKMELKSKVLFAWWGAEEIGLLGSRFFVNQVVLQSAPGAAAPFNQQVFLPSLTTTNVKVGLNFDMLGSPNFVRYVYTSSPTATPVTNAASLRIQNLFENFFNASNLPYVLLNMTGGSDFLPFVENGIATGALATGAGSLKTPAEREIFGGLANAAYDPCYHLSCDTTWNINVGVLQEMSQSAAYVVQALAAEDNLTAFLYS